MGRKRNNKNDNSLPAYVYRDQSAYVYRPYSGKGMKRVCIKLCSKKSPISEVWLKWEELQGQPSYSLEWLLNEYKQSPQFAKNAKSTQEVQEIQINAIIRYHSRSDKTFGAVALERITSGIMRKYLDKRAADGSPVAGNREKALISKAWNWALERDIIPRKWPNPCDKVVRNPEKPRDRYVTDEEYEIVYNIEGPAYIKIMMEFAYLCRMRRSEILQITKDQILDEGFDTKRLKGSRDAITEWSERLSNAVTAAKKIKSSIKSVFLLHDQYGQPITIRAFQSAWYRRKAKMRAAGVAPFNFHDLKRKGVSDFPGTLQEKQEASGHKTLAMVGIYDVSKHKVKATK